MDNTIESKPCKDKCVREKIHIFYYRVSTSHISSRTVFIRERHTFGEPTDYAQII